MTKEEKVFNQVLLEAVDEGLLIIGESGRNAIYFHLQNSCSLKREDIPEKPEVFMDGLKKIFGLGAQAIEMSIVKCLYSKLGLEFRERKDYDFLKYLDDAKNASGKEG
ncbi:MAG: hypothetical protein ACPLZC_05160 [Candidatus Bathyarchaeales archaeon]